MHRLVILAAFAATIAPEVALAEERSSADRDNQVVCRREQAQTGSFIRTRVCMTRAEWREVEQNTQRSLRNAQDRDRVGPSRADARASE